MSAVFFEVIAEPEALEKATLRWYRHFVGALWTRYGEGSWMGTCQQQYVRPRQDGSAIVEALRAIQDPLVASSASMILDVVEEAGTAQQALIAAFDHSCSST